jgi:hypothetical protein
MIYAIIAMLPCGLLLIDLMTMVSMSSQEYHMNDTLIVVRQGYICITRDGLIIMCRTYVTRQNRCLSHRHLIASFVIGCTDSYSRSLYGIGKSMI